MNKIKILLSLVVAFCLALIGITSMKAKANVSIIVGVGYYSDFVYVDKTNNLSTYSNSQQLYHTLNNSNFIIYTDNSFVYAVLDLSTISNNLSTWDRYYLIIYSNSVSAETDYIYRDELYYLCQFGYCDNALFTYSGVDSKNYKLLTNSYNTSIQFNNYAMGVDIDYFNSTDTIGWIIPISLPINTNYELPCIVFKFNYQCFIDTYGSISSTHNIPYQYIEDYQYNAYSIIYNDTYAFENDAYDNGLNDGYKIGKREGNNQGYSNGYGDGYADGLNSSSSDYGIKDLFFTILDMPIMLMKSLFAFTIFDTVAWSLIASFIGLGFVIWLIRKFIK